MNPNKCQVTPQSMHQTIHANICLNIYKTLTFLRSNAIGTKSMRHTKMVDGSMDSPQYGGHRRPTMMSTQ